MEETDALAVSRRCIDAPLAGHAFLYYTAHPESDLLSADVPACPKHTKKSQSLRPFAKAGIQSMLMWQGQ